MKPWSIAGLP